MVFSSTTFLLLFLPALLVLYYFPSIIGSVLNRESLCDSHNWKNAVLLIFSILFYAWGEPVFVFIMLTSIFVNWLLVLEMEKSEKNRKTWLILAITLDVLLLGVFKYASFISRNIAALVGNEKIIVSIALPIGISFFTFQLMSYVFDVYYGHASAQGNLFHVALYICLFPQLIAGPIVRYQQIEEEITDRNESFLQIGYGARIFIYGLAKKVLLANFLAQVADNCFDAVVNPTVMYAWLGAVAYTLQIYFDFSGYSDMAIGLGQMFGFHFLENFNYPYISGNITEFWRRWHISLSTWFRDYVYIPMGGNRVKKSRWVFNLFIVWLLTGIWHGANWTFLLWGLIYFATLLLEKLTGIDKKRNVLTHIWTLLVVILAWVFFRATDIASGAKYIASMFGIGASGFIGSDFYFTIKNTYVIFLLAIFGSTPCVNKLFRKLKDTRLAWIEYLWLILIFCASLVQVVSSTYNPFIYFNF